MMEIKKSFAIILFLFSISQSLQSACTGTSISGAGTQTIPSSTTYYVAAGNTQSGTVTMAASSSVFCLDASGTYSGGAVNFSSGAGTINNDGNISNGTRAWPNPASYSGATINNNTGATMTISSWSTSGGTFTITNYGTLTINNDFSGSGGTVNINNYGIINITGDINVSGSGITLHNYSGSTMTVSGTGGISFSAGTLINDGTLSVTYDISFSGGTLTNGGTVTCRDLSISGSNAFTNNSIINVTRNFSNSGTNTRNNSKIYISGDFTNSGTIILGSGAYWSSVDWTNSGTITGPGSGCAAFEATGTTSNSGTISSGNSSRVDVCDRGSPPSPYVDSNSGSLNSATYCTCSTLPVSFMNFTAEAIDNKQVHIQWTTASETNNDYFSVERSSDGVHFERVTKIKGAGTSSTSISYSTIDDQPLLGLSYYRIRQTDFDGKYSFSRIAAVKIALSEELRLVNLFPVPAGERLTFIIYSPAESESKIEIVDAQGKYVSVKHEHLIKGVNEFTIETSAYSKGLYLLRVVTTEGMIMKNFSK